MGFFGMGQKELLNKLERDYRSFTGQPNDLEAAWLFFVTALHMLDYQYPEDSDARTKKRDSNPILRICAYVGNEGKHCIVKDKKLMEVVSKTELHGAAFQNDIFQKDTFQVGIPLIHLKGDAALEFGPTISALEVGHKVMAFWRNEFVVRLPSPDAAPL